MRHRDGKTAIVRELLVGHPLPRGSTRRARSIHGTASAHSRCSQVIVVAKSASNSKGARGDASGRVHSFLQTEVRSGRKNTKKKERLRRRKKWRQYVKRNNSPKKEKRVLLHHTSITRVGTVEGKGEASSKAISLGVPCGAHARYRCS